MDYVRTKKFLEKRGKKLVYSLKSGKWCIKDSNCPVGSLMQIYEYAKKHYS